VYAAKLKYQADKKQKDKEKEERKQQRALNSVKKQNEKLEKAKKREEQLRVLESDKANHKRPGKACSNKPKRQKRTLKRQGTKQGAQQSQAGSCSHCGTMYGHNQDSKKDEEWHTCHAWFHESCAEQCGVLDDLYFTCITRV